MVGGTSLLGNFLYQPIQLCYHDSPTKVATILLAFKSLVIGELQGQIPTHGTMVAGSHLHMRKVKLQGLQNRVRRLITNLQPYINANTVPPLILNQHCSVCEYRTLCRKEAVASDNLSLLGGMTEREIVVQNRKGIFTVNQLSYTFRYRKPSKRAKRPAKPHQFSLQALALRTQKVHIHGTPNLAVADPAIYYDVEGLSHPDFYYLIGMLLVHQNNTDYRSFWADSERELGAAFQQFAEAVTDIPNIRKRRGEDTKAGTRHLLGWLRRVLSRPRWTFVGGRVEPATANRGIGITSAWSRRAKTRAAHAGRWPHFQLVILGSRVWFPPMTWWKR
jgi:predicted RecB family nuclease